MPPKPVLLYGAGAAPLLKASTSTLAPLTAGMPKLSAACPERKLTMPTLKVSCAATLPAHRAAAAAAANRIIDRLAISSLPGLKEPSAQREILVRPACPVYRGSPAPR